MIPILEIPIRHWHCPACGARDVTREAQPHTRYHHCRRLGLSAPMIEDGRDARLVVTEREDYIGSEQVQLDANGRPIMAVSVEYGDGSNDLAVYAPTATGRAGLA